MNILEKTKTYLVGPMQYQNGEGWREYVEANLSKLGIITFNPYKKPFIKDLHEGEETQRMFKQLSEDGNFDELQEKMREIRSYDLNLVDRSDFIIAYINPMTPTFGSMEEIVTAVRMKKPIFIWIEGGKKKCPLWIFGMIPNKYIYDNIDDILNMLHRIDSGEKEIDSDRWRLLRKEYR